MFGFAFLVLTLVKLVAGKDITRALFVLNESQLSVNLVNTGLQDRAVFTCTKDPRCKILERYVKDGTSGESKRTQWLRHESPVRYDDCLSLQSAGGTSSGIYSLRYKDKVVNAPCDMTTDGGGWVVFQRRVDAAISFHRDWNSYKNGFGNISSSFWLGLDLIHHFTKNNNTELRVDMETCDGHIGYAKYDYFFIADEGGNYELMVGGYSGTAGDCLRFHNGVQFSTYDRDNDHNANENCAIPWTGGNWFKICLHCHLNGKFSHVCHFSPSFMTWYEFQDRHGDIAYFEAKLRRKIST